MHRQAEPGIRSHVLLDGIATAATFLCLEQHAAKAHIHLPSAPTPLQPVSLVLLVIIVQVKELSTPRPAPLARTSLVTALRRCRSA